MFSDMLCLTGEDDGQDEPEHVAEHDHLQHVQIRPLKVRVKTFTMLQKISISNKCCSSELSIHL